MGSDVSDNITLAGTHIYRNLFIILSHMRETWYSIMDGNINNAS